MTAPVLPAFVLKGAVVNTWLVAGTDTSADADTAPDVYYPQGSTIKFEPSIKTLTFAHGASNPKGTVLTLRDVIAQINSSGDIVTTDGDLLELIANVGQTSNASLWHWTCTPTIDGVRQDPFAFNVTAGATNYLSEQMPLKVALAAVSALLGPAGPAGVGAPPVGTPDGYLPHVVSGSTVWVAPSAIGAGGSGIAMDTDGVPYLL